MKHLSKVCDAADWFDADIQQVIEHHLREPLRFHRKQWEFAVIFNALKQYGRLTPQSRGLSLGGGNERVLYAIANQVRELCVTDLYDEETSWDTARTGDPRAFVLDTRPFPVDETRLDVRRMDMRNLTFEDGSFDFAYSSCAMEHIGHFEDFQRHLQEVYRVLRPGGYYVLTTEFHFGAETICDENNYVFSGDYLQKLLEGSPFSVAETPSAGLTRHEINLPYPSNLNALAGDTESQLGYQVAGRLPHVVLLRGGFPFTSVLLILQKNENKEPGAALDFRGRAASHQWLMDGVRRYRELIGEHTLHLHPFSASGPSRFCADHAHFFAETPPADDTLFHTDYHWLGNGEREIVLTLETDEMSVVPDGRINLRVHRFAVLDSAKIDAVIDYDIRPAGRHKVEIALPLAVNERYCYAVLAKTGEPRHLFRKIQVRIEPVVSARVNGLPDTAASRGK